MISPLRYVPGDQPSSSRMTNGPLITALRRVLVRAVPPSAAEASTAEAVTAGAATRPKAAVATARMRARRLTRLLLLALL
ncbi:hypothetical protein ACIP4Y_35135 [Streptomyces sp. NPDC088810]|uniref:hypothetical protein n=1 Tax=Streptomyces sp. NPDC088810 TaxID=3365904 RepID=UPI00380A5C66